MVVVLERENEKKCDWHCVCAVQSSIDLASEK